MPTPSEAVVLLSYPEEPTVSFASCPPEQERETQQARVAREDSISSLTRDTPEESVYDEHMTSSATTPEPDTAHADSSTMPPTADLAKSDVSRDGHASDDDAQIGGSTDATPDNEARLALSMSNTAISSASTPSPQYLYYSPEPSRRSCNATSSFLRPGSKFRGSQQSDRQVYDVQVEIKDVDMAESFLCGYLRIQGLTDDHPTLTTFFEGEIIGPKHLFRTTHPSWGSNEKVDLQHWARFPAWRPLAKSAQSPDFTLKNYQQREHLFMRWKEYFLVPDHRVKTITGASFEGFYYICFNQCTGDVSGIYFHAKSEKYQQLELKPVDSMGCVGAMEFR